MNFEAQIVNVCLMCVGVEELLTDGSVSLQSSALLVYLYNLLLYTWNILIFCCPS